MKQYKQLTQEQRYQISILCKEGFKQKKIAKKASIHPSTVSRELKRNCGKRGYHPKQAHEKAESRKQSSHKSIKMIPEMVKRIEEKIRNDWSPEQITGYYRKEKISIVSHEKIYQHIWKDKRAGGDMYKHLRHSHKKRKKRYGSKENRGQIKDRVFIDQRPKIVENKKRIGDWEIDTMIGKNHKGAIVTIVERKSKKTIIAKTVNKSAEMVTQATTEKLMEIKNRVLTITGDNGKEFAYHKRISKALDSKFYFAHPYHSWERGLNENTNGLLRQYFPKGTKFEDIQEEELKKAEDRLNNRPRKNLGYKTPNEVFNSQHSKKKKRVNKRRIAKSRNRIDISNGSGV